MSNLGNKEIFAENLNYYIEKSGKTQRELCELVGVATSTFNDWTKARKYPRIDKIEILADLFGIRKSDLIEKRITNEDMKKADAVARISHRLLKDDKFFEFVCTVGNLDEKEFISLYNIAVVLVQKTQNK